MLKPNRETVALASSIFFILPAVFIHRKERHDWQFILNISSSLFSMLLGCYFDRHKEDRVGKMEAETKKMNDLLVEANAAKTGQREGQSTPVAIKKNFSLAANLYSRARSSFENIYKKDIGNLDHEKSIFYLEILYNEAFMNYRLDRLEEAYKLVSTGLNKNNLNKLHFICINKKLLNLRGLITFIQGCNELDKKKQREIWSEAKKDFNSSFKLDSGQNNVHVFLMYLSIDPNDTNDTNNSFFSKTVQIITPGTKKEEQVATLNFDKNCILHDHLIFLYAESCAHEKEFKKSLTLYKKYKTNDDSWNGTMLDINPEAFFSSFILRLRYLEVCKEAIESYPSFANDPLERPLVFDQAFMFLNAQRFKNENSDGRYSKAYKRLAEAAHQFIDRATHENLIKRSKERPEILLKGTLPKTSSDENSCVIKNCKVRFFQLKMQLAHAKEVVTGVFHR